MSRIRDILSIGAHIEPMVKACYKSYTIYKLTSNFGRDYEHATRSFEGQMARLQILADTQLGDLLQKPTDDEAHMSDIIRILQDMRVNFEKCQYLMKYYADLSPEISSMDSSHIIMRTNAPFNMVFSDSAEQQVLTKGRTGTRLFKKLKNLSLSSASTTNTNPTSTNSERSKSPLYDRRVTVATEQSALRASDLQKSSSLHGRIRWAATDREEFISAVAELSKGNKLLERRFQLKPLSDPAFHGPFRKPMNDIYLAECNRSWLNKLHRQLLDMNSRESDLEFSIRLTIDEKIERTTNTPFVEKPFDLESTIFALQAHSDQNDRDQSLYLLAEVPVQLEESPTKIDRLIENFRHLDPTADPAIQAIGVYPAESMKPNMRLYQDCTSAWRSTTKLSTMLLDSRLRDPTLQRYHVQLALLVAYSFAILPCTYEEKDVFPDASTYVYYSQFDESAINTESENGSSLEQTVEQHDDEDKNSAAEDLLGPWYRFHLGSQPRKQSTKALGKRPGIIPTQQNSIVALGILLSQIGLWELIPVRGGVTQMRLIALQKSQDLIKLSGVEFEEITRRCLDWKEIRENGERNDPDEMLQMVFSRLSEHNRALQRLL